MKLKMSSLFMSINKLVYFPFSSEHGTAKIIYDFLYHVISACHTAISLRHTNTPAQNTPVTEQSTAPTVSSGKKKNTPFHICLLSHTPVHT